MEETNKVRLSVSAHAAAAILVAFLTSYILPGYQGGLLGIAVLIILGYPLSRALGKGAKWWLSNGLLLYLFIWLVGLIYIFNIGP